MHHAVEKGAVAEPPCARIGIIRQAADECVEIGQRGIRPGIARAILYKARARRCVCHNQLIVGAVDAPVS